MPMLVRRTLALLLISSGLVVFAGPGRVSACSCASVDPVAAAASADVVFTGSLIDHVGGDTEPVWTFAVDGWVKGDIAAAELVVEGQDYGFGCGTPYEWGPENVAVFADQRGDRLISIGCSPMPTRADFERALDEAAGVTPTGTGEPAALVVGRSGAANLRVLDDAGELLLQSNLAFDPTAAAHCPGTSLAAFWSYGPPLDSGIASTRNVISIVDLNTMDVVGERGLESEFVSSRDDMVCLDGGERVVVGRGFGPNEGRVTAATSNRDDDANASRNYVDVSRVLVHPTGTLTLLPSSAGGPLRTLSSADLEPLAEFALAPDIAATHGAFSADGSQLAMLVTTTGIDMAYNGNSTHVLVVDVTDGVVAEGSGELIELEAGGRGRAKWIEWFDDTTWVVERETDSSKIFDVHSTDGARINTTDAGWGWGLLPLDGQMLRARDGGVELIDRAGQSTELTPPPGDPNSFSDLALAPMIDAPALDADAQPTVAPLVLRDVAPVEPSQPGEIPAEPDADDTLTTEPSESESNGDSLEPSGDDGFPWPVAIIGGLVIVGGLIAVRGEFANWRRRRADRSSGR